MNFDLTRVSSVPLNINVKESVLDTNFELFQTLFYDGGEFEVKEESGVEENTFVKKYYFCGELVSVAELSISEDGEKMILEKLGTINGYRNEYISCEEYRLEFEQSMKKLRKKLNILSKFDENVPFMKGIGKFVLWDIIDYAKENDISQIELQKDITNEEFYEKVLGSLEEDNTIVEYEILGKLVCIYL